MDKHSGVLKQPKQIDHFKNKFKKKKNDKWMMITDYWFMINIINAKVCTLTYEEIKVSNFNYKLICK